MVVIHLLYDCINSDCPGEGNLEKEPIVETEFSTALIEVITRVSSIRTTQSLTRTITLHDPILPHGTNHLLYCMLHLLQEIPPQRPVSGTSLSLQEIIIVGNCEKQVSH